MNDSTRFTLAKTSVIISGIAGALTLTACSGVSAYSTVSGRLDDTRWVASRPAVTTVATHQVPVYDRKCTVKTRTKTTGTGKSRKTSTESYQDCKNVRTGSRTETYTKTLKAAKPAMYCVELDYVDNDTTENDQWFEVSVSTYHKWVGKAEGTKVKNMAYLRTLISCTH